MSRRVDSDGGQMPLEAISPTTQAQQATHKVMEVTEAGMAPNRTGGHRHRRAPTRLHGARAEPQAWRQFAGGPLPQAPVRQVHTLPVHRARLASSQRSESVTWQHRTHGTGGRRGHPTGVQAGPMRPTRHAPAQGTLPPGWVPLSFPR